MAIYNFMGAELQQGPVPVSILSPDNSGGNDFI